MKVLFLFALIITFNLSPCALIFKSNLAPDGTASQPLSDQLPVINNIVKGASNYAIGNGNGLYGNNNYL
jgi:hypothetical protein